MKVLDDINKTLEEYCETQTCHDCGLAHPFMDECLQNILLDLFAMFIHSSKPKANKDETI